MAIVVCPCGAKNRPPSLPKGRVRCGKCKHVFTPAELVTATPEAPKPYTLNREDDISDDDDPDDLCPDCGGAMLEDPVGPYCPRCDD